MKRLLVVNHAACIAYVDKERERDGDYLTVARLPYCALVLEWMPGKHPPEMRAEIQRHADAIIARRGEEYQVSTCGQTVLLGGK